MKHWAGLALMVVVALAVGFWVKGCQHSSAQESCQARGGTLVAVTGGRGGWVCLPPAR